MRKKPAQNSQVGGSVLGLLGKTVSPSLSLSAGMKSTGVQPMLFSSLRHLWMRYIQHVNKPDKGVLPIQAGIRQQARFISPLGLTTIVEMLLAVLDNKRNDVVTQAFFQLNKPFYDRIFPSCRLVKALNMNRHGGRRG